MKPLKENLITVFLLMVVLGLVFYWYELRPNNIRAACSSSSYKSTKGKPLNISSGYVPVAEREREKTELEKDYENLYQECLRSHGLNK